MLEYRLYHLDGAGRVGGAEWVKALDDDSAVQAARALCRTVQCEIWQGPRLVATIPPHEAEAIRASHI